MSPTPDSPPPAIEGLQFDKAEIAARKCAVCQAEVPGEYFQVNGADVCPACAEKLRAQQGRPTMGGVARGVVFGFGAALVCAAGYGLFTYLTNFEFGLIAIAVGWVVGRAVRMGARGLGGRRCQWAALLLTYFAITMGYVPLLYSGMQKATQEANVKLAKEGKPLNEARPVVTAVVATVMAPALPFLSLTEGISGILGIIIIGVGLHQAWKMTARHELAIEGPLGVTPEESTKSE